MKKLLTLLLLVSISSFAQDKADTVELTKQVIEYYNDIVDSTPSLETTKTGIKKAEELYLLKEDKTKLSYVLAVMYTVYATKYTTPNSGTSGFKHKGTATPTEIETAKTKAIQHYKYYVEHTTEKDDTYRAAQSAILRMENRM